MREALTETEIAKIKNLDEEVKGRERGGEIEGVL